MKAQTYALYSHIRKKKSIHFFDISYVWFVWLRNNKHDLDRFSLSHYLTSKVISYQYWFRHHLKFLSFQKQSSWVPENINFTSTQTRMVFFSFIYLNKAKESFSYKARIFFIKRLKSRGSEKVQVHGISGSRNRNDWWFTCCSILTYFIVDFSYPQYRPCFGKGISSWWW